MTRTLLLALALGFGLASPSWAAPPINGEELIDDDGFLGMRPGQAFWEALHLDRLGPPHGNRFLRDAQGAQVRRMHWQGRGASPSEGDQGPHSLWVQVIQTPKGWVVDHLQVGARFYIQPTVKGLPLGEGKAIRQALAGAVSAGGHLVAEAEGLRLMGDPAQAGAYASVQLFESQFARFAANSTTVHQGLFAWRRGGGEQVVASLRQALGSDPATGSLLTPAVVRWKRLDDEDPSFTMLSVKLPQHSLAQLGLALRPEDPPAQDPSLRLPSEGSAQQLKPGDVVVLRGRFVAFVEKAATEVPLRFPPGRVVLGALALYGAYPKPQRFTHMALWQGVSRPVDLR